MLQLTGFHNQKEIQMTSSACASHNRNKSSYICCPLLPVGRDGGEKDPGSSSQQVHCLFGLCIPDENRVVSGHDHHEWRRPKVRSPASSVPQFFFVLSFLVYCRHFIPNY